MADIMTPEQRKNNMRAIKAVSKIETIVAKELWKNGIRYRRNNKKLFGKPDISIQKYKIVIFIDSCFWHQCPLHATMPKSNVEFWKKKLERNVERDKEVNEYYLQNKWRIKRIWEHEIKNDLFKVVDELMFFIEDSKKLKD